jgi:hypothetical protein
MKTNMSQTRIGGAFLVFSLLVGIGIALSTRVQAQSPDDRYAGERRNNNNDQYQRGRNWERYGNYGGSSELRQTALNAGYNEGVNEARRDRETGRSANLGNQDIYQRATKDYSPRLGDRELYRRYFREAFEDAYNTERYNQATGERAGNRNRDNDGKQNRRGRNSDGYGNFGGSFQLRQTALNAGFNEGVKQGRTDRSKRNGSGFQSRNTYQKATKDYSSELGDREVYQRYFREAYEHGYADGYAGY